MSAPVRESKTNLPPWTRRSFRSDVALRNLLRNTGPPSRSSASSAAISTGFIALSCRLATLAAPGSRQPEAAQGAP